MWKSEVILYLYRGINWIYSREHGIAKPQS